MKWDAMAISNFQLLQLDRNKTGSLFLFLLFYFVKEKSLPKMETGSTQFDSSPFVHSFVDFNSFI